MIVCKATVCGMSWYGTGMFSKEICSVTSLTSTIDNQSFLRSIFLFRIAISLMFSDQTGRFVKNSLMQLVLYDRRDAFETDSAVHL